MRLQQLRIALAAGAALAVAACGGGGGVDSTPYVENPVTPPNCTDPCLELVKVLPAVNQSTGFATAGVAYDPNTGDQTNAGFAVSYDASSGEYVVDIPSAGARTLYENTASTPNATYIYGSLGNGTYREADVLVLRPDNPELELTYSSLIGYGAFDYGYPLGSSPFGWLAFGVPTAEGAVPVTGSASYTALARGSDVDRNGMISGIASLLFSFGSGDLSGHLDLDYSPFGGMGEAYSLGRFEFSNTVYSSGSTTYSGELTQAGLANGSFSGQFTGPAAEELIGQWSAPFVDPISNATSTMIGAWVGRRDP